MLLNSALVFFLIEVGIKSGLIAYCAMARTAGWTVAITKVNCEDIGL